MYVSDSGVFLLAEMAAIHHPQIYREESGLCGCEFKSGGFLHTIFFIKDSEFTDLDFVHLYVVGFAYCLWCWRCQILQRYWHPRLHLQHLHGWQVCMCLCASLSHHVLHDRCTFTYQTSFPNSIFPCSRCFNNSDGDFLIGEEKGCGCFRCHLSQEQW